MQALRGKRIHTCMQITSVILSVWLNSYLEQVPEHTYISESAAALSIRNEYPFPIGQYKTKILNYTCF